jgi:hypothetical protein
VVEIFWVLVADGFVQSIRTTKLENGTTFNSLAIRPFSISNVRTTHLQD